MAGSNLVPVDQLKIKANQYGDALPSYQKDFIDRFAPYAMLASAKSGIPARFLLAEASIETDWGRSKSAREDNNLFGIKASPGQIAAGVKVNYRNTGENRTDGSSYTENSPFVVYDTPEAGFNGFIEKLNKTQHSDQKALLKYVADNPYAQDNDVERNLAGAFARTSYLTADKIDQTMLDRMARMPSDFNSVGFKTATDFNKATTDLAKLAPYQPSDTKVSSALGEFTDNDYVSPNGIPTSTVYQRPAGVMDSFSDAITGGLEKIGRDAKGAAGEIASAFGGMFGDPATTQPAPGSFDFAWGRPAAGQTSNGSLNPALDPYQPAPGATDFSGANTSGGVANGSLGAGIRPDQPAPSDMAFGGKFDASAYLTANPDVAANADYGTNAWQHYLQFGLNEGRAIDTRGDKFDAQAYLKANPDVAADASYGLDPLRHFRDFGLGEGRAAQIVGPDGTVQSAPTFAQGLTIGPQAAGTIGPTQAPTIGPSGIFDAAAYLRANPDIAADAGAVANPLAHYLRFGGDEGRVIDDNGDKFDAATYEAQNADVLAAGMDPLLHYVKFGQAEGRMAPIVRPDGSVRLVSNLGLASPVSQDLATQLIQAEEAQRRGPSAGETGLNIGPQGTAPTIGAPGLSPTIGSQAEVTAQNFDAQGYLNANPDVAASGIDPWKHYSQMGRYEGRQAPTLSVANQFSGADVSQGAGATGNGSFGGFDPSAYLAANPDVARDANYSKNPLLHYEQFGFNEGRAIDPAGHAVAKNFDPSAYLAANPDVAASHMDPLAHLLQFGLAEGRAVPTGNNPYQFSAYNVSQGAGPTGNGSFGTGIGQGLSLTPVQTIGAPALTPTIGPSYSPTIGAGPAISAYQGLSPTGFSNANVGGALGATAQGFGDYYGTSNMGMDVGQPQAQTGGIGEFAFSGANVGGFDVNGFGGAAPQASGQTAYGPPTFSSNFNPQSSENAYLDSQVNAANASNAALDAFNPAIRNGVFTSSTGDSGIYKQAADYNVATLAINQANLAKPPAAAAAPVNVPRVAQGAFAPAPFFGRW